MAGGRGHARRGVAAALTAGALVASSGCGGGGGVAKGTAVMHFHSRPDLTPPIVTVATSTKAAAPGDLFIAPKQYAIQKGPEIVAPDGQPVWFEPVPQEATDFRVQTYEGRPVLTWWEGPPAAPVSGSGVGHGVIMNSSYQQIARVDASFGPDTADLHEFQLAPGGIAIVTAYRIVPADLSSVGGPVNGKAADCVIEEIDVASKRVLFEWHSIDHIPFAASYAAPPPKSGKGSQTAYDYVHVNSVDPEPNGDLLVSARNTHAVYEIDGKTGDIVWTLGGKQSTFKMGPGTTFYWQHDARLEPDGTISIFDDGASPQEEKESRAIRIRLDLKKRTATLVHAFANGALAISQGNAQLLPNGDTLVGWGSVPRITEFSPTGRVVYDATFTDGDDSYRAYRFTWTGTPKTRPAIAVGKRDGPATVYASWNGATQVASWRVLGGTTAEHLTPLGAPVRKTGFETTMRVRTNDTYLAVEALDARGRVLAQSAAVRRGREAIG